MARREHGRGRPRPARSDALRRGQGNPGTWVWIGVSDAAALYDEVTAQGATIRLAPTNFPWACEMQVQDPDGHILRFGSGPLEDEPFGEWANAS